MEYSNSFIDSREAVRRLPPVDQKRLRNRPIAVSADLGEDVSPVIIASAATIEDLIQIMSIVRPDFPYVIEEPLLQSSHS